MKGEGGHILLAIQTGESQEPNNYDHVRHDSRRREYLESGLIASPARAGEGEQPAFGPV